MMAREDAKRAAASQSGADMASGWLTMRWITALFLTITALAASPASADGNSTPIARLQLPQQTATGPWGPLALAVIERDRARATGRYTCPPTDDPDEICLGYEIVEGGGEIIRYLAPPTAGWQRQGRRQRFRFTGGHATRWVDSPRSVAIIEQTEAGHRWVAWSTPVERGWACFPQTVIDHFQLVPSQPWREYGGQPHCIRVR